MFKYIIIFILMIYLTISLDLLLGFCIFNYNATYTNLITNEKISLKGIKKFGAFTLLAFSWPYSVIKGNVNIEKEK